MDEDLVLRRAAALADEVLSPAADALDRDGGFPRAALHRAAELGLLGIHVPADLGGLGAGPVAYARAIMRTAAACAATTVAMCVSNMVAEIVTAFGTLEQRRRFVPRLCDGSLTVGAFALSEPGSGSDPGSLSTRARPGDGGGWVLDGSKMWVTSGSDAGLFVVWARESDLPGTRGISCFLVPAQTPGVRPGPPEAKLGLHGSTTTPLELDGARLPGEARLGGPGEGFRIAMMALDGGRIGIAAQACGIADAALTLMLESAAERAASAAIADAATGLEAARLLTLRAATLKGQGVPFTREASQAKLYASEHAGRVCELAMSAIGPTAYHRGLAERLLRDVRVTTIYEGTSEIQRWVLAREVGRRFRDR